MRLHEQRIFNFELQPQGRQAIRMPKGAQILGVVDKYGFPWLLAAVDELEETEIRHFRVVTTGEIFNREILDYVGTLRIGGADSNGAWYTMHVFEIETALTPMHADPIDPRYKDDLANLKTELKGLHLVQSEAS